MRRLGITASSVAPTVIDFISDASLLGPFYEGPSWNRWRAVLKAAYALPMTGADRKLFAEVSGDRKPPAAPVRELVALAGRGAGKDAIAAHMASTGDFSRLRPGERGYVLVIAVDRPQSGVAFGYIKALFEQVPMLAALVEKITDDTVLLTNGAAVTVATNSYRSVRGKTIICVIYDEVCFWRSADSATPDFEVDAAVGPGLARWPGAIKVMISSVYRRTGLAYERHRASFGVDDPDTLVVLGTTQQFNPGFDVKIIERDLARDYEKASAEYLSRWRDDISGFVDREAVMACVIAGLRYRPYLSGNAYRAFCDPSGGRGDSMTIAVAHADRDGKAILDCILETKPPFDPKQVVKEFASLLKNYHLSEVIGDNYAGEWPVSEFKEHGITYTASERNRSAIYLDLLPLINSNRVELLDIERLINQLCALERHTTKGGRDSVNHPETGGGKHHDDVINAAAGALVNVIQVPASVFARLSDADWAGILTASRQGLGERAAAQLARANDRRWG